MSVAGLTATPLTYGVAAQVDTQSYGVEADEPNTAAPFTQQCGSGHSVGVARTA
jgi:hypothetical protein